jgi:uncharacterized protein YciI
MHFVIEATYIEDNAALWHRHVAAHIDYMKSRLDIILAAGGLPGDADGATIGALYIIESETEAEARAFIEADPFAAAGIFTSVTIRRWRKSFFDHAWLAAPAGAAVSSGPGAP